MSDITFVGSCKEKVFDNGGKVLNIGFSAEDRQILEDNADDRGWTNVTLARGRESGKPYLKLSTFKVAAPEPDAGGGTDTDDDGAMPF